MQSPKILNVFLATLFVFFLLSISKVYGISVNKPSSNPLIAKACSSGESSSLCVRVLQSHPRIASAKNVLDISIKIIETGISDATETCKHIQNQLKKPNVSPDYKSVLKQCNSSFLSYESSFKSALGEIVESKEFKIASYDLLIGYTDALKPCVDAVKRQEIKDEAIIHGIASAQVFGMSAFHTLSDLDVQSESPPSSSVDEIIELF